MDRGNANRWGLWLVLLAAGLLPACQQEMAKQPAYRPLEPSAFFADGRSARPLVPGTVARGQLRTDNHLFTGKRGPTEEVARATAVIGSGGGGPFSVLAVALAERPYVDTFPFPVTREVLERGRQRFTIFCAVCHGPLGQGNGIVVQRGFTPPPSYHTDRLRTAPVGYFYDVVTNGFGSMPDHSAQIPPRDRWAIVAYIRVLQLSQHAPLAELPDEQRNAALSHLEDRREDGK
jgi:mono/diheme cytochrome c family protein